MANVVYKNAQGNASTSALSMILFRDGKKTKLLEITSSLNPILLLTAIQSISAPTRMAGILLQWIRFYNSFVKLTLFLSHASDDVIWSAVVSLSSRNKTTDDDLLADDVMAVGGRVIGFLTSSSGFCLFCKLINGLLWCHNGKQSHNKAKLIRTWRLEIAWSAMFQLSRSLLAFWR